MSSGLEKNGLRPCASTNAGLARGERFSEAYVNWTLFLSSYVPLLLIFGVRMWPKNQSYSFFAGAISALLTVNLLILMNQQTAPRDFFVNSTQGGANEIGVYVATYILPFLVVSDVGPWDLAAYALLIWLIGVVMTRDEVLHVNPLLAIFGLRLFTIMTGDGESYFVITARRLRTDDTVRGVTLRSRLLYER